jgi:hypothetical protein|tara:strand:- start:1562 stop:1819 length:258 start_codon:yes stop_codon:yes gene_type:complete
VAATKETITPSANLSVTNDKKVALIALTGEMTTMTTSNPKATKSQSESTTLSIVMDGNEIEREYEEIEFDDFSDVDYDLDYTTET